MRLRHLSDLFRGVGDDDSPAALSTFGSTCTGLFFEETKSQSMRGGTKSRMIVDELAVDTDLEACVWLKGMV